VDDTERDELYELLVNTFERAGLEWVTDEVADLVAEGFEAQVTAAEWTGSGRPKKSESRTTRRPFTSFERVDLLLEAVGRVVSQGVAIEASLVDHFRSERESDQSETALANRQVKEPGSFSRRIAPPSKLVFRSSTSQDVADERAVELEASDFIDSRQRSALVLFQMIQQLRTEVSP